jgi:hypothetical protein
MPLESKRRQKFTRIAVMRIIFTRIGCTLLTCDMYMSDLRHIHDPVLSSLKMEGIRLLFSNVPENNFFLRFQTTCPRLRNIKSLCPGNLYSEKLLVPRPTPDRNNPCRLCYKKTVSIAGKRQQSVRNSQLTSDLHLECVCLHKPYRSWFPWSSCSHP